MEGNGGNNLMSVSDLVYTDARRRPFSYTGTFDSYVV